MKQKQDYGTHYEAANSLYRLWGDADAALMSAVKAAMVVIKNNTKAQNPLKLFDRRKQTISGWMDQAAVFNNNLLEDENLKKSNGRIWLC